MKDWEKEFVELGANLEHERWANWQKYLHSLCIKNKDSSLTIPPERVKRWKRQIVAKYSDLSETEKEMDRIEVRKYLPLIRQELKRAEKRAERRIGKVLKNHLFKIFEELDEPLSYYQRGLIENGINQAISVYLKEGKK